MANPPYLYSKPQISTPFPPTGQALPGDAWGAPTETQPYGSAGPTATGPNTGGNGQMAPTATGPYTGNGQMAPTATQIGRAHV